MEPSNEEYRLDDEIEEYFREVPKRLSSIVTLVKKPENETIFVDQIKLTDDIFNLNSLDKDEYMLNIYKKYKKNSKSKRKHKKSKKSRKKKRKKDSTSPRNERKISSKRNRSPSLNYQGNHSNITESISNVSSEQSFNKSIKIENKNEKETFDQHLITPSLPNSDKKDELSSSRRESLENRLEKFTFPQTINQLNINLNLGDQQNNQIKPIVNHFNTFNQSYNQFYNFNRFDQYNFINHNSKKSNNLIVIEPKKEELASTENNLNQDSYLNKSLDLKTDVNLETIPMDLSNNDDEIVANKDFVKYDEKNFKKQDKIEDFIQKNFENIDNKIQVVENCNSKDKILEEKTNKIHSNNEEDFEALRNKFRMQLEERLFDKNDKKLLDELRREQYRYERRTRNDSIEEKRNNSESDLEDKNESKKYKNKKSKDRSKHRGRHHKSSHERERHLSTHKNRSSKKERKKYKRHKDEEEDDDDDEDNDEIKESIMDTLDDLANSLRRSSRIKVIETKKQYTKELEIAEKVKKLSTVIVENTQDSETNDAKDTTNDLQTTSEIVFHDSPSKSIMSAKSENSEPISLSKTTSEISLDTKLEKFEWPSGYEQIDENFYLCTRNNNKNKESKKMICDCTYSEQERQLGLLACGGDCLNRMLLIECGNRCPCGEFCTNRNFKQKNNAKMIPFKTVNKGWGLKIATDLKSETFLIEYVGEVIDLKEFKKRCEKYSEQNNQHFYFMALQNDLFIDATKKGNISRFFNHSCDPNCETQKWTVNGELRVGFFTRRPVKANEELTFDYQFQTVGKKQQKCYCGSEKCRGYLGASSNNQSNQLNYIWDSDSEDGSSEDHSTSDKSQSENDSEIEDKENKSISKRNKVRKNRNKKDYDLNRQIKSIQTLSNKENVLKLCQLMFRTENLDMRLDILDLLLNTRAEISLRLFMDYHGLKLLWSWMIDIDNKNDSFEHLECKLKILDVLSMLSIKNRSILEECKLLVIVKRWSETELKPNYQNIHQFDKNSQDIDIKNWTELLLKNLLDVVFEESEKKNEENYMELTRLFEQLKLKAKILYDEWNSLKVAFKIPKKQQIEERKEHERELNEFSKDPDNFKIDDKQHHSFNNYNQSYSNYSSSYKNSFKFRHNKFYNPFNRPFRFNRITNNLSTSNLTKEQRRQLFEQRVREEERAAAEAAEKAAAEEAEAKAKFQQTNQELKWIYDSQKNQWIQTYVPVNNQVNFQPYGYPHVTNSVQTFQYNYNTYQLSGVPPPIPPPPAPQSTSNSNEILTKINITESSLKNLQQAVQQFAHSTQKTPKKNTPEKKVPLSASKHRSLAAIAAKLPPGWKCKRNNKGFVYYYNLKTKKTQWNFPKITKSTTTSKPKLTAENNTKQEENIELKSASDSKVTEPDKISPTITSTTSEKIDNDLTKSNGSEAASASGSVSTSSNTFKMYRDQFREKLSKLIIKLLEPFLKKDCKYGHIRNNDDFKHLARKFTHTIMEKEISRTTNLEGLDLDKRIKLKAQDYVWKYMQRFRDGYLRSMDT
ncbi:unnamed protein product [Brachionus calyciflorus]|uniref:[histone H3]-lysine(36) N-trimethyltransferase n=1 Tax=Brachionus calyciflorus TaxID=104777 RepID=A0A813LXW2_9BILA|nr:unnamed protein product [Brachionus calyciflorus]